MDALQAAILRVKFKYLDQWTTRRQTNTANYRRVFKESGLEAKEIAMPSESGFGRHIYHLFVIRCTGRNELMKYLRTQGIGTEVYYPVPLHLQECFSDLGYQKGNFPESEKLAEESLAIPIYPELTEEMQFEVVNKIIDFFN